PAHGPAARGRLDGGDGLPNEVALLRLRHVELVHPAPSVTTHLVTVGDDVSRQLRCAFEALGGGGEGRANTVAAEERHHAPRAGLDAVLVVALIAEGPDGLLQHDAQLVHSLRRAIAFGGTHLAVPLPLAHRRQPAPRR